MQLNSLKQSVMVTWPISQN